MLKTSWGSGNTDFPQFGQGRNPTKTLDQVVLGAFLYCSGGIGSGVSLKNIGQGQYGQPPAGQQFLIGDNGDLLFPSSHHDDIADPWYLLESGLDFPLTQPPCQGKVARQGEDTDDHKRELVWVEGQDLGFVGPVRQERVLGIDNFPGLYSCQEHIAAPVEGELDRSGSAPAY